MTTASLNSQSRHGFATVLWFTTLCSLLGALWALNLFPQAPITYRTQTTVILNSSRLETLKARLASPNQDNLHNNCISIHLLDCKDLTSPEAQSPVEIASSQLPDLYTVVLESRWNQRVAATDVKEWLAVFSQPSTVALRDLQVAKDLRWVQYRISLAKDYATADKQRDSSGSESKPIPLQTVSYKSNSAESNSTSPLSLSNSTPSNALDLTALVEKESLLRNQLNEEHAKLMGTISLSSLSKWSPAVSSDPLLVPILGLFLGAVVGFTLAYLLQSTKSKNTEPGSDYENVLKSFAIPLFRLEDSSGTSATEIIRPARSWQAFRQLPWWISGCEWSLLAWGVFAAGRFVFDPMWRELSVSQPLVALARLFSVL